MPLTLCFRSRISKITDFNYSWNTYHTHYIRSGRSVFILADTDLQKYLLSDRTLKRTSIVTQKNFYHIPQKHVSCWCYFNSRIRLSFSHALNLWVYGCHCRRTGRWSEEILELLLSPKSSSSACRTLLGYWARSNFSWLTCELDVVSCFGAQKVYFCGNDRNIGHAAEDTGKVLRVYCLFTILFQNAGYRTSSLDKEPTNGRAYGGTVSGMLSRFFR